MRGQKLELFGSIKHLIISALCPFLMSASELLSPTFLNVYPAILSLQASVRDFSRDCVSPYPAMLGKQPSLFGYWQTVPMRAAVTQRCHLQVLLTDCCIPLNLLPWKPFPFMSRLHFTPRRYSVF